MPFQSTPPARGATKLGLRRCDQFLFQSTPPARGATARGLFQRYNRPYFNPRPPRGERRKTRRLSLRKRCISIHAPREGSDLRRHEIRPNAMTFQSTPPARGATAVLEVIQGISKFQSTPPARGATLYSRQHLRCCKISIHAPREGSDLNRCCFGFNGVVISIHAPREGSDANATKTTLEVGISIHAPREGSDTCTLRLLLRQSNFNPRPPRGERQS